MTPRRKPDPEAAFAAAMRGKSFGAPAAPSPCSLPPPARGGGAAEAIGETAGPLIEGSVIDGNFAGEGAAPAGRDAILLGRADGERPVTLDLARLLDGRLLIQGASGAGKSWTLRRLLEESAGRIQQLVIDPEGEFRGLAEMLGHLHVEAAGFDGPAIAELGRRVRQHRLSLVLDVSELGREEQMIAVAAFLHALIEAPREHWQPALVAVDEAHLFAPFGGQAAAGTAVRRAATGALVDLMSLGRKRGLAGVLATQRLARLAKSVVSEVLNFLIGINTLDLDVRRAAETIGWDARRAFDRLPLLEPGQFVAAGPAIAAGGVRAVPVTVAVGTVKSRHAGAAPVLGPRPAALAPEAARALIDLDALAAAQGPDPALSTGYRAIRSFIRQPEFPLAGRVFAALKALMPDGAALDDLAAHLAVQRGALDAAVALLDSVHAVEISGQAVRVAPRFLSEAAS